MKHKIIPGLLLIAGLAILTTGCQTTAAQRGALGGGALGALTGQIIGGDTEGTLIGAGVGALGGAILNDHVDRQKKDSYYEGYNRGTADANPPQRKYEPTPQQSTPPPPPESDSNVQKHYHTHNHYYYDR